MSNVFDALKQCDSEIAHLVTAGDRSGEALPEREHRRSPDAEPVRLREELPFTPPPPSIGANRRIAVRLPSGGPLLPFDGASFEAAEQYRILRTKVIQHPGSPQVVVVSSAGPGDGKSVSAINLAGSLALKTDSKALLIDADLRRSSVHLNLGLPIGPGLNQVLEKTEKLYDVIVQIEELPNLFVLTAGAPRRNPAELLDSDEWPMMFAALRQAFRFIIVDSPPIAALTDYDLIQTASDGVILVVRPDHTDRSLCLKALQTIPKKKLIGVLMNCVPDFFPLILGKRNAGYAYYGTVPGNGL